MAAPSAREVLPSRPSPDRPRCRRRNQGFQAGDASQETRGLTSQKRVSLLSILGSFHFDGTTPMSLTSARRPCRPDALVQHLGLVAWISLLSKRTWMSTPAWSKARHASQAPMARATSGSTQIADQFEVLCFFGLGRSLILVIQIGVVPDQPGSNVTAASMVSTTTLAKAAAPRLASMLARLPNSPAPRGWR